MTPWNAAHQALLSMRFSRQGYWSGLPFPSPGDLPDPGIEPRSPALQEDSLSTELQGKSEEYNHSGFGIEHLVMSMCRVFSCVVGRGCLLWPVRSLGKTLLAFHLLQFVLQGQICLLLHVFLDFLLLHSSLL